MIDKSDVPQLSQAISFALEVQSVIQDRCICMEDIERMEEIVREILPEYPGCMVDDHITFTDGSVAILTNKGFTIK